MRRHELDPISLVTGLVFVAIAVAYLIGQYIDSDVSAGWVLPLGLIGLGLAGLTGSLRRGLRNGGSDHPAPPVEAEPAQPHDGGASDAGLS